MYRLTDLKPPLVKIIAAMSLIALATVFACTTDTPEDTPIYRFRTRDQHTRFAVP